MFSRVFLVVLDGLGIGATDDAAFYDDKGSNTLLHTIGDNYNLDVLELLGLTKLVGKEVKNTRGIYTRISPQGNYKDSLNSHYEIMGAVNKHKNKTYPDGLPLELVSKIQHSIGIDVIGNENSESSSIINKLGQMHMKTGCPIIYTSYESAIEVAAHEDVIPVEDLYAICERIFKLASTDEYKIARVIAKPFTGKEGSYTFTGKRKDFTIDPPINVLDYLDKAHIQTICVGKVPDLFNEKSVAVKIKTKDNIDGMFKLIDFAKGNFEGLLFANLSDFDSLYGHKRDKSGFLKSLEEFNYYLPIFLKNLKKNDLLLITADHGCDPTFKGNDHTREMVPLLMYSPIFKKGKRIEDRNSLADIGATILDNFNIKNTLGVGRSIFEDLRH